MQILDLLDQSYEHTDRLVDGVGDDQWGNPTPCEDWDVRALVNHLTNSVLLFGTALNGRETSGDFTADVLGDDPIGAYRQAVKETAAAWRQPGVLERTVTLPFGEIPGQMAASISFSDVFVHGLDLAKATGQDDKVDQDLAETALEMIRQSPIANFRMPGVFGPEAACADAAPASDRLLAFLGRTV